MIPDNRAGFSDAGRMYLDYLSRVLMNTEKQYPKIEELVQMIRGAQAVHIYGFGRSGAAALALAIRLRHFCNYLPPVWWVGDQVREPFSIGDLVILFSGSGNRPEVKLVARKAKEAAALLVLVTASEKPSPGARLDLLLKLPSLPDGMSYGGGDFELAAFFLQEVLVTHMGRVFEIPGEEVGINHV
jgi:6-phospho-3-hexuloisomerase